MLIGSDALEKLKKAKVIIFGLGGVGSYAVEALARAGIGHLTIVDFDNVDITNINRQLIALGSTVGKRKVDVMADRISDINDNIEVLSQNEKVTSENIDSFDIGTFDYVVDAIDDIAAKVAIIKAAKAAGANVISSMGTGNKLDPEKLHVADISKTHTCPLARKMRSELKAIDIKNVNVIFSDEAPIKPEACESSNMRGPASISFVPSVAGLMIAGKVIRDLI